MRIAFCGASACGKSTLAAWVSETYGLPINPVGSRSVAIELGFVDRRSGEARPFNVDVADAWTYQACIDGGYPPPHAVQEAMAHFKTGEATCRGLFQARLLSSKIAWETERDRFVTDRTTLDNLAYSLLGDAAAVTSATVDAATKHMARYDVVFYCPLVAGQWLGDDGARQRLFGQHFAFDALLSGLLNTWRNRSRFEEKRVYMISKTGLDERKAFVRDVLAYRMPAL